ISDWVDDVGPADAPADRIGQTDLDLFATVNNAFGNNLRRAAIVQGDDHVLRDVRQLAGEVTRVGRLEGRVSQALSRAVGRAEVLEHGQAFAEVGLDRRL